MRYLHIIYTTIRIWRHPSPGIIPVRRKKDAVYNPGEHSPTSLPPPLLQGSATPWRGGSAVPLFRYRVLGHRHRKKGEAPEGSNETLGIRKVLYMQYMA